MSKRFYGQYDDDHYVWDVSLQQGLVLPQRVLDIGAGNGVRLSNSRAFIEAGWEAVLVEPNPVSFAELQREYAGNPRVRCYQLAVSNADGNWCVRVGANPDHSRVSHDGDGVPVEMVTYRQLMERTGWLRKPLGLLTVDTEGHDAVILEQMMGCDPQAWWVIAESLTQHSRRVQLDVMQADYHLLNILDLNCLWVRRDIAKWVP